MFLQKGDMHKDSVIDSEVNHKPINQKKSQVKQAHERWKKYQKELNQIDYSQIHYRQLISSTNKL